MTDLAKIAARHRGSHYCEAPDGWVDHDQTCDAATAAVESERLRAFNRFQAERIDECDRMRREAVAEAEGLRWVVLEGGLRLPDFGHYRERVSSKPSDPSDERWDCSCGYAGTPGKVRQHWGAMLTEKEGS